MSVSGKDRDVLRELAAQVAEVAALPAQQETIALWKALNALRPVRPMVMLDQIPWHELEADGELTLATQDDFCRRMEGELRRTLYAWRHMRGDQVVEPVVDVAKVIRGMDFGVTVEQKVAVSDPRGGVVGHYYFDQFKTEADLERIRTPAVALDERATAEVEEKAHALFDGLLTVRMRGAFPAFAPWDRLAMWRGAENILYDLADRPEFLHRLMSRLTDAYLSQLDQLESKGLLGHGQGTIHCSGAYTDELPAPGFDPLRPRAKDLWTCGMAQVFSTVSPAMHQEFELDYAARWYSRFGLVYYGCCEPLHDKIDIIRRLPHVRKISMSPWVDVEQGAARIGRDFVFSSKPSPAFLARDTWEPAAVERDLRGTLACCARHGCPVEFILKDVSTVRNEPRRLREWAETAMRVVQE